MVRWSFNNTKGAIMTAMHTQNKPKVYMTEREMKRIFNLPRPALQALEDWEKNNKTQGQENGTTTNKYAE